MLQVSSRHCSEKEWQEEDQQRHWIMVCNMWCFRLACSYPKHLNASLLRDVEALPVVWEMKMRCVKFWLKVLNN